MRQSRGIAGGKAAEPPCRKVNVCEAMLYLSLRAQFKPKISQIFADNQAIAEIASCTRQVKVLGPCIRFCLS
jgi:hypothetical protein